jgi:hypothetical protein
MECEGHCDDYITLCQYEQNDLPETNRDRLLDFLSSCGNTHARQQIQSIKGTRKAMICIVNFSRDIEAKILAIRIGTYTFVVRVSCGLGIRKGEGSVEHIETLILHRTHVEIIHGNNIVHIQIIFQSERILIPHHGLLQTRQCMIELGDIFMFREYLQMDGTTRWSGGICGRDGAKISSL